MHRAYTDEHVSAISGGIAAAIDAATLGAGDWSSILTLLTEAFPGSFSSVQHFNVDLGSVDFWSFDNNDSLFRDAYVEHFGKINPWNKAHWNTTASGVVQTSEDIFPARLFRKSEFYNDWLLPQGVEAASGMKIDGDNSAFSQISLQYPLKTAPVYDQASAEVLRRVRGNLYRSIAIGKLLHSITEQASASAALVERGRCAALVVDGTRLIRDANQRAVELLANARALKSRLGRLSIDDKSVDEKFGQVLGALSRGVPIDGCRLSLRLLDQAWHIVMAPLPSEPPSRGLLSLVRPHSLVLILVVDLSQREFLGDMQPTLKDLFGLTPSECALCEMLCNGKSLSESADRLQITIETARTRLKAVFLKTGTSKQGQLVAMLAKLL